MAHKVAFTDRCSFATLKKNCIVISPEYVINFLQRSSNFAWYIESRSLASRGGIPLIMGPLQVEIFTESYVFIKKSNNIETKGLLLN